FRSAFITYGMPNAVLSDHGPEFAGFRQGFTQFEKWLMNHDILPVHGRIKHPQTQGKIERFHRAMKDELLKHTAISDIDDAERKLQAWREKYNTVRPHEALKMRCPAEVYVPSEREYDDAVTKHEYGGQFHVIKVNSWGYVRFDKWQTYLSETMVNERVEIRPDSRADAFVVCYRNFKIARFSAIDGKLIDRSIFRL
ncbi:MAG: integrase core domain-containing protein, partial [Oscillospiraceae bacterium]|nr:integrase core domain-containing protein [Oscillospiraceae bacterium]